jgi:sporulation protein YlmC with PRC-barrel domain
MTQHRITQAVGIAKLYAKTLLIAAMITLSIDTSLSAGEDFSAIRRFLDSTSPLEAKTKRAPEAKPETWQKQDRDHFFLRPEMGQRLALELLGRTVVNPQGEFLGEVEDLVIGPNDRIIGIVVSRGGIFGFGGQKVGVRWSQVSSIGDVIEIRLFPFRLADAPGFVPPPEPSSKE